MIHYFDHYSATVDPEPLLDGSELIRLLEIAPGPEVGRLLRIIREAQAAGDIATQDEALALARQAHRASSDP
jgi:poly(A) polymerase/tRNA nucleotidyltransferase (CCA-adding enzyme)